MNKAELIDIICEKYLVTKRQADAILTAALDTIIEAVAQGDKVTVNNFGSFEPRQRMAREARNPQTGSKIEIAATKVPVFSAAQSFRDKLNAPPPEDVSYYFLARGTKLYQEAVEYYTRVIQFRGAFFNDAYSGRGDVYRQMGEYEKAIQDYTQAINNKYLLSITYEKRGLAYLSWGDKEKAILDLKKSAERFLHYGNEGKYNNLLTQVRKILNEIVEEGRKKTDTQDYIGAIEDYNLAIQIDPNNRKASDCLKIAQLALKQDQEIAAAQKQLETEGYFTPKSLEEAKKKTIISIVRRQGQSEFRQTLLEIYNYRCAITECDVSEALEAAHIIPYIATENNNPSNGLLLRADLHTLFDLNLITIDPEKLEVILDPRLRQSSYGQFHSKRLQLPQNQLYWPKKEALKWRCEQCNWYS